MLPFPRFCTHVLSIPSTSFPIDRPFDISRKRYDMSLETYYDFQPCSIKKQNIGFHVPTIIYLSIYMYIVHYSIDTSIRRICFKLSLLTNRTTLLNLAVHYRTGTLLFLDPCSCTWETRNLRSFHFSLLYI
jgi:hypothetical protein